MRTVFWATVSGHLVTLSQQFSKASKTAYHGSKQDKQWPSWFNYVVGGDESDGHIQYQHQSWHHQWSKRQNHKNSSWWTWAGILSQWSYHDSCISGCIQYILIKMTSTKVQNLERLQDNIIPFPQSKHSWSQKETKRKWSPENNCL